ncbi:MAG: glycosyltransferase [Fidelibacterota bacterium]
MHIAFLNPQGNFDPTDYGWTQHPDFGGQLVYVKEVALAMGEDDHRVDIITRQIDDTNWPEFAGRIDGYLGHDNVRILRFPCGPLHFLKKEDMWPYIYEWVNNILLFYENKPAFPDIFTGHYADGGLAGAMILNERGKPYTFTGHSLGAQKMDKLIVGEEIFLEKVRHFHFDKRITAERLAMSSASRIITSTKQERMIQYGHHLYEDAVDTSDEGKFAVIPPGVNLSIFARDLQDIEIPEKVERMIKRDISESRRNLPLVICSSRLDRKKNHLDLVKAWAVSPKLKASANLAIITRGSENPMEEWMELFSGEEQTVFGEIMDVIENHDLAGCITAFSLNSQTELAACYQYLAKNLQGIFALTAVYEPFGLAPLEAIASGLPVVVTKNGGPSESLKDKNGKYGVLVDPQDPQDIAEGILLLATDVNYWKRMRAVGRKRVQDKYTWQKTAKGYFDVFESILSDISQQDKRVVIPQYFYNSDVVDVTPEELRDRYFMKEKSV